MKAFQAMLKSKQLSVHSAASIAIVTATTGVPPVNSDGPYGGGAGGAGYGRPPPSPELGMPGRPVTLAEAGRSPVKAELEVIPDDSDALLADGAPYSRYVADGIKRVFSSDDLAAAACLDDVPDVEDHVVGGMGGGGRGGRRGVGRRRRGAGAARAAGADDR